jgi:hypothetical protein
MTLPELLMMVMISVVGILGVRGLLSSCVKGRWLGSCKPDASEFLPCQRRCRS